MRSKSASFAESGVSLVGAADIRSRLAPAIEAVAGHVDRIHVHIDLDVLNVSVARANSFAAGGGLTLEDVEFALALIGRRIPIAGISVSAYDPAGDNDGRAASSAIRLVSAAVRARQN